jgi:hypothetical protein
LNYGTGLKCDIQAVGLKRIIAGGFGGCVTSLKAKTGRRGLIRACAGSQGLALSGPTAGNRIVDYFLIAFTTAGYSRAASRTAERVGVEEAIH